MSIAVISRSQFCRLLLCLILVIVNGSAQGRTMLFAAMDDWPPFIINTNSVSSDSGFDGIDRELLQEMSARTGIQIYLLRYPFARALRDMQGKVRTSP